ncbi:hypothetical protein BD779DRAFT_1478686 [Infundibulicybe gibba]|nr:hypothetical protein BD779DRAFT_1478686 [Infundibulicybe gibba]
MPGSTELRQLRDRFPPTFTRLTEILLSEAQQSDFLESHWYHFYGEILFTISRAASSMEVVFSVAAQRTFTFIPPKPVVIDRANRVITRPRLPSRALGGGNDEDAMEEDKSEKGVEGGANVKDNEDVEDGESVEEVDQFYLGDGDADDALMADADTVLDGLFGDDPDTSGSTATTGYNENATLRTPDFSVFLHNFKDKTSIPVITVENKPTPLPKTVNGELLDMTEGDYVSRRVAASREMARHRAQKTQQLTHLFDEYRNLRLVYYCLTVGEWFRVYKIDREKFLAGRQRGSPMARLIWDNGVLSKHMLEPWIGITQPGKFQ